MRVIRVSMLLMLAGMVTTVSAQSLTTTGTFTPAGAFNPANAMWVAVDPIRGAGTVSVDVRDPAGSILAAPVSFTVEKIGPQALPAKMSRLPQPSMPLRLEVSVKPYQNAAPVVRAAGIAGTQQQALAAVKVKIDEVKCVGATCPVCYSLEQNAQVTLDTYPDVGGNAVRTASV